MADAKLTALDALAAPAGGDLLYIVDDPAGTPVSKKITVSDLFLGATPITVAGGTVAVSTPVFQAAQTWNDAGVTFHADDINITNTASAATSTVLRRRVGGSSVFEMLRTGRMTILAPNDGDPFLYETRSGNRFGIGYFNNGLTFGKYSSPTVYVTETKLQIQSAGILCWPSSGWSGTADLVLLRDAANVLALRNGTNAQTNRLYGTYTDGSNYRRLTTTMSTSGVAEIKPEGAGTGASGNVLHISGLPTSNPGPGILWNNAGTPAIGT